MSPTRTFRFTVVRRIEDWLKGESVSRKVRVLLSSLEWSKEQIEAWRIQRLVALVTLSSRRSRGYKDLLQRSGVTVDRIRSLSDLPLLPVMERELLRGDGAEMFVDSGIDRTRLTVGVSSGSTGEPVRYYKDREAMSWGRAACLVGQVLAGIPLGAKKGVVWGNSTTVEKEWSRAGSRLKARAYGEIRIAACRLTTRAAMVEAIGCLEKCGAEAIYGYANAVWELAKIGEDCGRSGLIRYGVQTTAETLSAVARSDIENYFGRVFDAYGCGEILGIAFQCQRAMGYHVVSPNVIVERVPVSSTGLSRILVTDLTNFAMPLIRYDVGDLCATEEVGCECGCSWECIGPISGRTADSIETPSGGRILTPSVFGSSLLKSMPSMRQYQLIEHSLGRCELRVVLHRPGDAITLRLLERYITATFPSDMKVTVSEVNEIKTDRTGKHRLVIRRDNRISD